MISLRDTKYDTTAGFLDTAIKVAEFYGFAPLETARTENRQVPACAHVEKNLSFARREERTLLPAARRCVSCATPGPVRLFWRVSQIPARGTTPYVTLDLHVIGTASTMAEALLVMVAEAIANDVGLGKRSLAINSIGTVESSVRFVRDIGTFLRKNLESIAPALRVRAAEDPLGTLVTLIEKGHPAIHRAPQAMEYLSEDERRRLWELLEYIETLGLSYELNPHVLGSRDCWSHALFQFFMTDPTTSERIIFAEGGRYDPLARAFAGAAMPAATITIHCELRGHVPDPKTLAGMHSNATAAPLYLAHLGPEARRRSLPLLETLRRMGISVHQSIMRDRIGDQMSHARLLGSPYLLIMGHKEAVEGTVLLREVATNSQRAVAVEELPSALRKFRLVTASAR